jgi:hypothetical protein
MGLGVSEKGAYGAQQRRPNQNRLHPRAENTLAPTAWFSARIQVKTVPQTQVNRSHPLGSYIAPENNENFIL